MSAMIHPCLFTELIAARQHTINTPENETDAYETRASSEHLRYTTNKCLSRAKDASILSWPTIIGSLKAVDRHIHSVGYDMA